MTSRPAATTTAPPSAAPDLEPLLPDVRVTIHRPDREPEVVDLRSAIVSLHTTVRVPDSGGPAGPTSGTPAPILRALLRNDGPSVRPGDLHDILTAHREPGDPPLRRPRSLRRVGHRRWAKGEPREALTGRLVPLVAEELLR